MRTRHNNPPARRRDDIKKPSRVLIDPRGLVFFPDRGENGHSDRFWALALHARGGSDGPCRMEALDAQTDLNDGYRRPDNSDDWR